MPKTYGLCEDTDVIGSMFFVMGLADGRSLWNGALPGIAKVDCRAMYPAMIATIADLPTTAPATIGLDRVG